MMLLWLEDKFCEALNGVWRLFSKVCAERVEDEV